jgi:hypothetical protein
MCARGERGALTSLDAHDITGALPPLVGRPHRLPNWREGVEAHCGARNAHTVAEARREPVVDEDPKRLTYARDVGQLRSQIVLADETRVSVQQGSEDDALRGVVIGHVPGTLYEQVFACEPEGGQSTATTARPLPPLSCATPRRTEPMTSSGSGSKTVAPSPLPTSASVCR